MKEIIISDALKPFLVALDDIKEFKQNPRINDPAVKAVVNSIKRYGFNDPIEADAETKEILAGHTRLKAAIKLDMRQIPVIWHGHLKDRESRTGYNIASNKTNELSQWEEEILFENLKGLDEDDIKGMGFTDRDIERMKMVDMDMEDGEIIEPPEEPMTKLGDLYEMNGHRLLCGDATKGTGISRLLNDQKADLIFTDPPYGISYASKNKYLNELDGGDRIQIEIKGDHLGADEIKEMWVDSFSIVSKHLNAYASHYICAPQGGELLMSIMDAMNKGGLPARHTIIWAKNNHVLGRSDYNYQHEPILYGWAKRHKFYGCGSQRSSVWNIDKPLKSELHPTMKPIELIINAILNSTERKMAVLDMFLGSGSTLIACEKTNRTCYGVEIDPAYCDVIINRWETSTGEKAVKCQE